jgi:hypothetical protein
LTTTNYSCIANTGVSKLISTDEEYNTVVGGKFALIEVTQNLNTAMVMLSAIADSLFNT